MTMALKREFSMAACAEDPVSLRERRSNGGKSRGNNGPGSKKIAHKERKLEELRSRDPCKAAHIALSLVPLYLKARNLEGAECCGKESVALLLGQKEYREAAKFAYVLARLFVNAGDLRRAKGFGEESRNLLYAHQAKDPRDYAAYGPTIAGVTIPVCLDADLVESHLRGLGVRLSKEGAASHG